MQFMNSSLDFDRFMAAIVHSSWNEGMGGQIRREAVPIVTMRLCLSIWHGMRKIYIRLMS